MEHGGDAGEGSHDRQRVVHRLAAVNDHRTLQFRRELKLRLEDRPLMGGVARS